MNQTKQKLSLSKKIAFTLVAIALIWGGTELTVLRVLWLMPWTGGSDAPYLYQPHPYRSYAPVPLRSDRAKTIAFNSLGLRGPDIAVVKPPNTIRIVCLGGSTTFSDGATTNGTTYPARLERLLRERYRDAPFRIEVVNAGIQAAVSLESLVQFETQLLELSPDVALVAQTINDCWFQMEFYGFRSDYLNARKPFSAPATRWWEYSPLLSRLFGMNSAGNPYFPAHAINLNAMIITQPEMLDDLRKGRRGEVEPEMAAALERNLRNLVAVARGNGVIPVLSTQSRYDEAPFGGRWGRNMARLNGMVLELAARDAVDVIDFAAIFPWNPSDYSDYCHFKDTPNGLGRQAEVYANGLIERKVIERAWEQQQAASRTPGKP